MFVCFVCGFETSQTMVHPSPPCVHLGFDIAGSDTQFHERAPQFRLLYWYTQVGDDETGMNYRIKLGPKDRVTL